MGAAYAKRAIFPKPKPSYTAADQDLVWVPAKGDGHMIPCMVIDNKDPGTDKMIIFFHGNGEDIGSAEYLLEDVCKAWKCHAIAVEYPTYGAYESGVLELDNGLFENDAVSVYDFLIDKLGINSSSIIILGRSIGSGPATLLAKYRPSRALFLFSGFLSVRELATKNEKLGYKEEEVPEHTLPSSFFNNGDCIKEVHSPTFILTGKKDVLVLPYHGEELYKKSPCTESLKHLELQEYMSHNMFDINECLILPGAKFMSSFPSPTGPIQISALFVQNEDK